MMRLLARLLGGLYAILIYAFIFLPVAVLGLFAFQAGERPVPPFTGPSLRWFQAVLGDVRLIEALQNSLLVAIVSSAAAVLLGLLAAFGLARLVVPGSGLLRTLITVPLVVCGLTIGTGLLILLNALGLPRSLLAAGIGHVVISMPLSFAILYSQMGGHLAASERSARDLGAQEWQVLSLVTAPTLSPAILVSFLLAMTFSWDEFVISALLTRIDTTLPVEIWSLLASGPSPKINAIGSLAVLVSIALAALLGLIALRNRP